MQTRRDMMKRSLAVVSLMASAGVLPQLAWAQQARPAFEAKTLQDALKAMGAGAPAESKDISVQAPDIAENGAVVPIGAATTLAGVKKIMLMVEKNPNILSASFDITDAVEPNISTRVKMGQSSNVYAVAVMNDGKVLYAVKEVKVTLGGCGG